MYKVFIADDEGWVIESLKGRINWRKNGFNVIGQASDGIDAYALIQQLMPDIVFTDIRMPGMNGIELIKKVYKLSSNIKTIVLSGYAEFDYAKDAVNNGALGYCLKPFNISEIEDLLQRAKKILETSRLLSKDTSDCIKDATSSEIKNLGGVNSNVRHEIKNETIRMVLNYIHQNFREDISIQNISNKFFLNPSYICRLFKKETGKLFTEYLCDLRIEYACNLLINSDYSIYEVGEKAGYSDYFYFNRVFKKETGKTPIRYRNGVIKE